MRDVGFVTLAAALMTIPSYIGSILSNRFKVEIPLVAVLSLALFLAGAFLLVRFLKD